MIDKKGTYLETLQLLPRFLEDLLDFRPVDDLEELDCIEVLDQERVEVLLDELASVVVVGHRRLHQVVHLPMDVSLVDRNLVALVDSNFEILDFVAIHRYGHQGKMEMVPVVVHRDCILDVAHQNSTSEVGNRQGHFRYHQRKRRDLYHSQHPRHPSVVFRLRPMVNSHYFLLLHLILGQVLVQEGLRTFQGTNNLIQKEVS